MFCRCGGCPNLKGNVVVDHIGAGHLATPNHRDGMSFHVYKLTVFSLARQCLVHIVSRVHPGSQRARFLPLFWRNNQYIQVLPDNFGASVAIQRCEGLVTQLHGPGKILHHDGERTIFNQ